MLVDMVSLTTNTSKLTLKHTDSKTNQRICIYGHQILSTLRNTGNFKDASSNSLAFYRADDGSSQGVSRLAFFSSCTVQIGQPTCEKIVAGQDVYEPKHKRPFPVILETGVKLGDARGCWWNSNYVCCKIENKEDKINYNH